MNATGQKSDHYFDDKTVKITVKCSSEECNALNFLSTGTSNQRYKQRILPILLYLYWFKHKDDVIKTDDHEKLLQHLQEKYNTEQAIDNINHLFIENKQKHLNAELSQINLIYNKTTYPLFFINSGNPRRVWEIIACCYEEQLLKNIFTNGFTPKQTYLQESFSNINKLKTIQLQSRIIASILCAFDFTGKQPEVDVINTSFIATLVKSLQGYVKIEKYRSTIMTLISGISLLTGSALTFNAFWGPVLFCWRYILKWTNHTYAGFYEFYSHQGKMNLDDELEKANELEKADTVTTLITNLMFRAFLKDVLLDECHYIGKRKDAVLCSIQTKLFKLHYKKFIDYRTKLFQYNLLHLIALNNNKIYKTVLTPDQLNKLNNQKCFNIRNNTDDITALCNFSENLPEINTTKDKIKILEQLGFIIDKKKGLTPQYIFDQQEQITTIKDNEKQSFISGLSKAMNSDPTINGYMEQYLLKDDNIILKF